MANDNDNAELRAPETLRETLLANFKPQPAIPALFVLLISVVVPVMSRVPGAAPGDEGSMLLLLIPVGIVVSCALAIAAGFCSLFPQISWIAMATWALKFTQSGPLPSYNRLILLAGIVLVGVIIILQIWRVQTGRFQPTVRVDAED